MTQLYYAVKKLGCPPRAIVSVKTDALILAPPRKYLPKLKALAETMRYCDLHCQRRAHLCDDKQQFLDSHAELTPLCSEEPVFKYGDQGRPLLGKYTQPTRDVAPPLPTAPWRDMTEEEACRAVLE